jgi:hypothetical protein
MSGVSRGLARALAAGGLLVLVGVGLRCAQRSDRGTDDAPRQSSELDSQPWAAAPSAPDRGGTPAATLRSERATPAAALPGTALGERIEPAEAAPVAAAEPQPSAAANPVAHMLRNIDASDRELLAEVERRTRRNPSAAVHQLVNMHQRGASRSELQQFIETQLERDIATQAAARRWLRKVAPAPEAQPSAPSPTPGSGGGTRRVKPLERSGRGP